MIRWNSCSPAFSSLVCIFDLVRREWSSVQPHAEVMSENIGGLLLITRQKDS